MAGEFEPNDSRNVTGTATTPDGRWTGQGQQPPLAGGQQPTGAQEPGLRERNQHEGWSSEGQPRAQQGGGSGAGALSNEAEGEAVANDEDMPGGENMAADQMGSESGAGGGTFTGPSGGQAGNSQAGFGGGAGNDADTFGYGQQNSGTEDAQADRGQLSGDASQSMGQSAESGWPQQTQAAGSPDQAREQIREHMQVVDAEGTPVGKVDSLENDRIKLTRNDSPDGQHHYLALDQVAGIEGDTVRLHSSGDSVFGNNGY